MKLLTQAVIILWCFSFRGISATQETEVQNFVGELMAARTGEAQSRLLSSKKNLVTADAMNALILQGDQFYYQEKYSETFTAYSLALQVAEHIGNETSGVRITRLMGDTRYFQGQYDPARELYQKSLTLAKRLHNKELMAYALLGIAGTWSEVGHYDEALARFRETLSLANEAGAKGVAALAISGSGSVDYQRGDYPEAVNLYQQSLRLYEELKDEVGISRTLTSLGIVHYHQGNYFKALEQYDQALKISEELEDSAASKLILRNIALVYQMQGDFGKAWNIYRRNLRLLLKTSDTVGLGWLFHNMGHLSSLEKRFSRAQGYYRKSLGNADRLGNQELRLLNLMNLGDLCLAVSDRRGSQEYYQQALAVQQKIGSKEPLSRLMIGIGNSHYAAAEFEKSLHDSNQATDLGRELGNLEVLWKSRTLAGRSQIKLGQAAEAKSSFVEAITAIERLRDQLAGGVKDQELFFESKLAPYHGMVDLLVQQRDFRLAFSYLEQTKARVLLDMLTNGKVSVEGAMTKEEREEEHRLDRTMISLNRELKSSPCEIQVSDLPARLKEARLDYDDFETRLYARHPELKTQRGKYSPIAIEELGSVLPERTAFLSYAVLEQKTYLFVLTRERSAGAEPQPVLEVYPIQATSQALDSEIAQLRGLLTKRAWNFQDSTRRLYDLLLRPAQRQLRGKTTLCISPEGALWDLPFQCLQPAEEHYLLDDYAVFYVPSLSALREMTALALRRAKTSGHRLLAFGNSALGSLAPVPESEKEVKELKRLYGNSRSRVFTGTNATEEKAKSTMGQYDVLHFATHSVFDRQSPLHSFLQLSPSAEEDGLLEARELPQMNLKADIAVLSACATGRGKIGLGEGIIGLSWAFFLAGCPTTTVSQWKVDSASTAAFMIQFHRNLLRQDSSYSKAAALRQAALKVRRSSVYEHPFYWAPFILVGGNS